MLTPRATSTKNIVTTITSSMKGARPGRNPLKPIVRSVAILMNEILHRPDRDHRGLSTIFDNTIVAIARH
jgi:hypothetical protein